jgi:hypothetical protein
MKTQYSEFKTKEKYTKALEWEYLQDYPEFTPEQINRPLAVVVGSVDADIKRYGDESLKMSVINDYKRILRDKDKTDETGLSQCRLIVLSYIIKAEEPIRYDVTRAGKVPFPEEHKEKYLEFISGMTKRVVQDMCATIEAKIPHTAKVEYQRLTGDQPKKTSQEENSQSFAKRFTSNKRNLKEIISSPDPSLSFADKISKKVRFDDKANSTNTKGVTTK